MSLHDKITFIKRDKIFDSRGYFLKIINGKEDNLPKYTGEVYVISAGIGECRANHYHLEAHEWFTLIQGKADMILEDVSTKERITLELDGESPQTIYVPHLIAHAFKNISDDNYILVTYTDKLYDSKDTVSYKLS